MQEKMKQGYLAKYYWILGNLSLDTLQSIIGYFFGALFCLDAPSSLETAILPPPGLP